MNNADWLDSLLLVPAIDDDGFTGRVVAAVLPKQRSRWPVAVGFAVFAVVAVLSLQRGIAASDVDLQQALAPMVAGASALLSTAALVVAGWAARWRLPFSRSSSSSSSDASSSTAGVPALNATLRTPTVMLTRLDELDEDTAVEVLQVAKRQRSLFGAVWLFFISAPFVMMALQDYSVEAGWLRLMVAGVFGAGFYLGTPVVVIASRLAFVKECEQLGIGRKLAHTLRTRLTIASMLYSPREQRDARTVAFLVGGFKGLRAAKQKYRAELAQQQAAKRLS